MMILDKMEALSDDELHKRCLSTANREKACTLELLEHLQEVLRRWLHLKLGYSSIWEYTHKYLGYSESQASERSNALRLIHRAPEAKEMIRSGTLTLTTAAKVNSFLKASDEQIQTLRKATKDPTLPKLSAKEILDKVQGRSKRDVERILYSISPSAALPRESERPVSEHFTQVSIVADQELMDLLREAKAMLKCENHQATIKVALKECIQKRRAALERVSSETSAEREKLEGVTRPAEEHQFKTISRYINISKRRRLWLRANGRCEYVSQVTNKRCESRHRLQIDHIIPFSMGGTHSEDNLRVLCAAHNLERARAMGLIKQNEFSKLKMDLT